MSAANRAQFSLLTGAPHWLAEEEEGEKKKKRRRRRGQAQPGSLDNANVTSYRLTKRQVDSDFTVLVQINIFRMYTIRWMFALLALKGEFFA